MHADDRSKMNQMLGNGVFVDGAKMRQSVRQSTPFNANHAFMHASKMHGETPQARELALNVRNTPAQLACGRICRKLLYSSDG